jgi:hypothetical protein
MRVSFVIASILAGAITVSCSGGGSSASSEGDPLVASQVQEILPADANEVVGVFVDLGGSVPASGALVEIPLPQVRQLQDRFIAELQDANKSPVNAANVTQCTTSSLQARLDEAIKPESGAALRIDLNACELGLLPKLPSVKGVYADMTLTPNAINDALALKSAVIQSFDGATAWPSMGAQTLDGTGSVIAVLDTGVEERHPALGSTKVLQGACFSTASNGGTSFCPNGQSRDSTSSTAGRSCAERGFSSRTAAIAAGCTHGTSMAAVAAMNYSSVAEGSGGIAKGASILPVQVFNANAQGALSANSGDLLMAVEWVTAQAKSRNTNGQPPIAALNMSLGNGIYASACDNEYLGKLFKVAFSNLRAQGVVPVAAAGNSYNRTGISFPACVSNALSVAAAKMNYSGLASYSNFSSQVKLVAIGGDTNSAYRMPSLCASISSFDCWSVGMGTSPATALVSGAVAALKTAQPGATPDRLQTVLTQDLTATDPRAIKVNGVPGLRLSASATQLLGGTPPSNAPGNDGPEGTDVSSNNAVKVCLHQSSQYQGSYACAVTNLVSGNNAEIYSYFGKVGSVSIRDALSNAPLSNRIRVKLYAGFTNSSPQASVSQDTPVITGIASRLLIRTVTFEALP